MDAITRTILTCALFLVAGASTLNANDFPPAPASQAVFHADASQSAPSAQAECRFQPASSDSPMQVAPVSFRRRAACYQVESGSNSSAKDSDAGNENAASGKEEKPKPDDAEKKDDENDKDDEKDKEEEEKGPATLFDECWHQAGPITAQYLYTGEVFNNVRGGFSTRNATRYRGNFDLTLTLDTEQACWWQGGKFSVYMHQSHGRTLSQDFVRDGLFYSNIDTGADPDMTKLAEYWYQHSLSENMSIKLGRQDANEYFAFANLGGDFINSSFITLTNVAMPTWPYQTLGVSAILNPDKKLQLGGGVYDHGRDFGQWWATPASRGMFAIAQADYQPFADCEGAPMTLIRAGAWYTSSDTLPIADGTPYEGNYGFYSTLDRMLFSECDDSEQGLGAFLQFSWAPPDRNQVGVNYGGGLVYRGLLPCRNEDTAGIGYSAIEYSAVYRDATGRANESALELFYKARVRDGLTIQPDLQYLVRPSGLERDALVVGLRFEVNF